MKHSTRGRNASKASPSPMYNCRATWLQTRGRRERESRGRGGRRHKLAAQITSNGLHVYNVNWEKAAFRFRPKDDAQQQQLLELHSKAESEKREKKKKGSRGSRGRQRNYLNYCANFSLATVNEGKMKGKQLVAICFTNYTNQRRT